MKFIFKLHKQYKVILGELDYVDNQGYEHIRASLHSTDPDF